jgi:FKBP-type peptidyl-prolyl cis-trans isomerase (trigger factor)
MPDFVAITVYEIIQQAKYQGLMPQLVDAVIDQKIIAAEALAASISVTPEELQQSADRLRRQYQLLGAEETFAWLDRHQMSIEDLEEMARLTWLADKLAQQRFGGLPEESTDYAERQQLGTWLTQIKSDRAIAIQLEVLPPPMPQF